MVLVIVNPNRGCGELVGVLDWIIFVGSGLAWFK